MEQEAQERRRSMLKRGLEALRELAHDKDPPSRIGRGLALGVVVGLLPIMGIQMLVAALLAVPCRANAKAAVTAVWITNPLTFVFVYYGCYRVGLLFVPWRSVTWDEFAELISRAADGSWDEAARRSLALGLDVLVPLSVGGAALGLILGPLTYYSARFGIAAYRRRHGLTNSVRP